MKVPPVTAFVALVLAAALPIAAQPDAVEIEATLDGDAILLETPPVTLQAMAEGDTEGDVHAGVFPPIVRFEMPVSGYLFGVEYELVDANDRRVPRRMLHHFNLIDPSHREMFLPISRRVFAAGQETGPYQMPKTLVGMEFIEGDTWVLSTMLHNPTGQPWNDVRLKIRIRYVRNGLPWPLAEVIPFQMDTQFPTGDKSFDLPPGKSTQAWEGSPVTEGRIVAIGSHMHEFATRIYLEDVTEGEVVWTGMPIYSEEGRLESTTRGEFYGTYGVVVKPDHVYRVTVEYENPTGETIPEGGMGVIAGLIIPADPEFDFSANDSDSLYVVDREHFMRATMTMDEHSHMDGEGR